MSRAKPRMSKYSHMTDAEVIGFTNDLRQHLRTLYSELDALDMDDDANPTLSAMNETIEALDVMKAELRARRLPWPK